MAYIYSESRKEKNKKDRLSRNESLAMEIRRKSKKFVTGELAVEDFVSSLKEKELKQFFK